MPADAGIASRLFSVALAPARLHSAFATMKASTVATCSLAALPLVFLLGCKSPPVEPPWVTDAKQIKVGMTRTEAEAYLPAYATIDTSFGSSGMHRDFYSVGENWRVALVYSAPFETNVYITEISTNGQKISRGPFNGWTYGSTPTQPVIAGPFISYVKSRGSKFVDPFGSFAAKVPIRREPDGAANRSQPVGSETNSTSAAAGSGR